MRILMLALFSLPLLPHDLDVSMPPGTPLDWTSELRRPVPTYHRASVPTGDTRKSSGNSTVVEEKKGRPLEFAEADVIVFFQGTSVDMAGHIKWKPPKESGESNDVATEGGGIRLDYPPECPPELAWIAATTCLRDEIHPEACSWAEAAAFCLEIGDGAYPGLVTGDGNRRVEPYLRRILKSMPPVKPVAPASKDLHQSMLIQLAAAELSGGYAFSVDPTFAWRTLSLGPEAFGAIHACATGGHPFLARNAVTLLGTSSHPDATLALRDIWKETKDPITWMRALLGLARRGDRTIIPDLTKALSIKDLPRQAAILYALGQIGDASAAPAVIALIKNINIKEPELLWSAIPALGRMKSGKEALAALKDELYVKMGRDDTVRGGPAAPGFGAPAPEPPGTALRILHQLALIAAAMAGNTECTTKMILRLDFGGLDAYHPAAQLLLADGMAASDKGADVLKRKIIANSGTPPSLRLKTLQALADNNRIAPEMLVGLVLDETETSPVRTRAMQLLGRQDPIRARETAERLLEIYTSRVTGDTGGFQQLIMVAAQIGGRLGGFSPALIVKATQRALDTKCVAGRDVEDTVMGPPNIQFRPPLVETLMLELGRSKAPEALKMLSAHLDQRKMLQGRAEAVLALAALETRDADKLLVASLDDKDGWVRYCAWRSLKRRSNQDHFADWIYGGSGSRSRAADQYRLWLDSNGNTGKETK